MDEEIPVEEAPATRASLLLRVRDARDVLAWTEFDRRYGPLVLAYCRATGWQPTDAEDIRQLVMAKLAKSLRGFEYRPEAGGFRRYLRKVIRGEMIRVSSRHKLALSAVPVEGHSVEARSEPEDAECLWEREWMRHHFRLAWTAVRESSEPASLEIFRRLLAGASAAGIAQAMDMTEGAVRKVKQRMCERLKAAITEQILDEEQRTSGPDL